MLVSSVLPEPSVLTWNGNRGYALRGQLQYASSTNIITVFHDCIKHIQQTLGFQMVSYYNVGWSESADMELWTAVDEN